MDDPERGWARLRRPTGLVEQTRWLFYLALVASFLLTLPGPLRILSADTLPFLAVAPACLIAAWSYRYLRRSSPLVIDLVEVAATTGLAVACPDPAAVFLFAFVAIWFRACYGTTRRVLVFSLLLIGGVLLAYAVWGLLPGRDGQPSQAPIFASLPAMLVTTLVGRHLALGLIAREQSQLRDAALLRLGNALTGVTDRGAIYDLATDCSNAICAATPEMMVLVVMGIGAEQQVLVQAGDFRYVPARLPAGVLPPDATPGVSWPLPDSRPLADAAGIPSTWLGLVMPEEPGGWFLLGGAVAVPEEAVDAMQSMINQVALALRTSEAYQELTTQANVDALTGLANRPAFTAALEQAIADQDRHVALLFLDLDDFKVVNDGLGHAAGDELLRIVASRLRRGVRPEDLCARLGGDEFAVLLPEADDVAATIAQRLVEHVATPASLKGRIAQVGASIGLAFASPGTSAEELVQHADIAMYAAKAKGKNRVQAFDPSLLREDGTAAFEAELAAAAEEGQLVVHYQPIMAVPDGSCVAVEALVRWQHPARGLLAPAEFISTAEHTGAIVGIGAAVLRRACADAAGWRGESGRLAVHVNVSAAQLTDSGFVGIVEECVTEHDMAPGQLVLEITESMVLDSPAIRAALDRLIAVGASIAIDDFGTGYSALSTLRNLPLDIVKIDKSFIAGGPSHAADEAVVAAIVQMAGRLGLQIVAEGVERPDQQEFLSTVGADAAQGYLYLRPTPAPQFASWLAERAVAARPAGNVRRLGPRRTG